LQNSESSGRSGEGESEIRYRGRQSGETHGAEKGASGPADNGSIHQKRQEFPGDHELPERRVKLAT